MARIKRAATTTRTNPESAASHPPIADASPFVGYHGTTTDGTIFDRFDPAHSISTVMSPPRPNFALDAAEASGYALDRATERGGQPAVMPVELRVTRPLDMWTNEKGGWADITGDTFERIAKEPFTRMVSDGKGGMKPDAPNGREALERLYLNSHADRPNAYKRGPETVAAWDKALDHLRSLGYDSLRYRDQPTDCSSARHYTKIVPIQEGTVFSKTTGEQLYSAPSLPMPGVAAFQAIAPNEGADQ